MANDIPRTPEVDQIIAAAERLGQHDGYVGVEHLFLAIVADLDTVPARQLRRMGIDLDQITAKLRETMDSESFRAVRNRARFLDGRVVEHFPDGRVVTEYPDGTVTEHFEPTDGS
ncbi:Clp protease N-terminal domain-containing protein [Nocardia sp. NPDC004604]|uniref:T-complex 10 C-terminal domain-containing protein n=1 Tax=Nocardia sp. NPDC004604 TaxID=3157013 RepID=UPI0033A98358